MSQLRRELRLRDLVWLNICAVASLRWVATAAHAGPGSITLWVIAALFFFLPSALVIARLSELFPEEGGMYIWTKRAFGDRHAFLCAWFYFISNVLYFPSLLLAGITMVAYAFGDSGVRFADEPAYALPTTVAVLLSLFLANAFGLKVAKWVSTAGGAATFVIAVILGIFALIVFNRSGTATNFQLLPRASLGTLNFWSQIAFAFIGLELAPIVSGEMRNPRRDLPRAAVIGAIACSVYYIAGTAALLVLLAPSQISPMTGLAQAGLAAAKDLDLPSVSVLFAALIGAAIAGQAGTYIAGNTRLPYVIGLDQYIPAAFARLHPRWKTPYVALVVQAVIATMFLVMAQLGETVRAAYQIMVDLVVIVTFIPFLYIFASGFRFTSRIAAVSGLLVTAIAIILSVVPPAEAASVTMFEAKVIGGCVFFGALGWVIFRRYEVKHRAVRPESGAVHPQLKNS
jgi:glutamate:GABA antiporter